MFLSRIPEKYDEESEVERDGRNCFDDCRNDAYPQIKSRMKASKDAAEVVPPAGSQVRKQVLNINAEVLKYQVPLPTRPL